MAGGVSATRLRLKVRGRVQGVGFRPFVYALAHDSGLSGWVANDSEGVVLEAQGAAASGLAQRLRAQAPPAARIDAIDIDEMPLSADEAGFAIRASGSEGAIAARIGPDSAPCAACLDEVFDPRNRRYLYPFTTCTHCGPRYTITRRLPYDRAQTALAGFPFCAACEAEYHDPSDRRFHAEASACPDCGPRLALPPDDIAAALMRGQIVAIKGLGGYQLACDARDAEAIARLRLRKDREAKPFAVMALNVASVARIAEVDAAAVQLLTSPERPIVLMRAKAHAGLAPGIAPGLSTIGVMLPAAPLHYLMFHAALGAPEGQDWLGAAQDPVFVMTSANRGGDPIFIDDEAARDGLAGIADVIAAHDRPVLARADDSVMQIVAGAPALIRRARGFAPDPVPLSFEAPPVLALGGYLKTTLCLTRGREAFVSPHIGDLSGAGTRRALGDAAAHLLHLAGVKPEQLVHDLHPDLPSAGFASSFGVPVTQVQHHHAHAAAVLAEHGHDGPALALTLDGYGHGVDGTAWGGELLRLDGVSCQRLGHLAPLAMPGGDRAAREPWRMAASILHALGRSGEIASRFAGEALAKPLAALLASGAAPVTSSAGRLFDAAAGLVGLVHRAAYEGEAAMKLQALVRRPRVLHGAFQIHQGVLDLLPLFAALDAARPQEGAELFHGTLIAALAAWAGAASEATGLTTIALGGGCFLNGVLSEGLTEALTLRGLNVLNARLMPPNDGGLSLGQAYLAARSHGGNDVSCRTG